MKGKEKRGRMIVFFVAVVFLASLIAGVCNAFEPSAMLTFRFDDGRANGAPIAVPIMERYGFRGVSFVETGPTNNNEGWVMSLEQVMSLQNNHGWEIGGHSITHPDLTLVTDAQLIEELAGSKKYLADHGINAKTFATPYGAYDGRVLPAVARYYESHLTAWPSAANIWPFNDYQISIREVTNLTTPDEVKQWVSEAIRENQWLVLLFHALVQGVPAEYQYNISDFQKIVDIVARKRIKVVTVSEALRFTNNPNLIQNSSFSDVDQNGWANNWYRDGNVSIDSNNNGNFPEPTNSLKIVGGMNFQQAWTDLIPVDYRSEYLLKMFQSVQDLTAVGWAVWIDEFDRWGYYLGGQWLGGNYANFIGIRYYEYKPSTSKVKWASIVLYTEEASQLTLYTDSVELKKVKKSKRQD